MTVLEITVIPESISAHGRHRKHPGKLATLGAHIAEHGLYDPLILTPEHHIIGGERCLLAILTHGDGTTPVPAYVVDTLPDAAKLLRGRGTHLQKPLRVEEQVLLGNELENLHEPAFRERRRLIGAVGGMTLTGAGRPIDGEHWPSAIDYIAEMFGVARSTYQRMRFVWLATQDEHSPEALRQFARTALTRMGGAESVYGAYGRVRQARLDAGLPIRLERRMVTGLKPPVVAPPVDPLVERYAEVKAERQHAVEATETVEAAGPKGRRKSLPDTINKHTVALVAALAGLEKAQADDRWRLHSEKLAPSTRSELLNALPRIAGIVANLHPEDSRKEPTA